MSETTYTQYNVGSNSTQIQAQCKYNTIICFTKHCSEVIYMIMTNISRKLVCSS